MAEFEELFQEGNLAKAALVIDEEKAVYNKETKSLRWTTTPGKSHSNQR